MTEKDRDHFAGVLLGIARSESSETVASVAQSLLDLGWRARYSGKYLTETRLPDLLGELRANSNIAQARTLFDALVAEYENYASVQVVTYPIMNLVVAPEGIQIGDILLRLVDDASIQREEEHLRIVLAGSLNEAATNEYLLEMFRAQRGAHRGRAVAEIRVVAQRDIAKDRARVRYDELIDFLNGAATLLYPLNHRVLTLFSSAPATPFYGLDILEGTGVASGSVYPILIRLEDDGVLASEWEAIDESASGRRRRHYYTLTPYGAIFAVEALEA